MKTTEWIYPHGIEETSYQVLTLEGRKEISERIDDSAVYLLQYYHELIGYEDSIEYTNFEVANAIGWTTDKVEEYNQKLIEAEYINL